jgi:hypothetical protein
VVEKLEGTSLVDSAEVDPQDQQDEDDDMPRYRYYESQKVLGKLHRAIDERQIFTAIQRRESGITGQSTVINDVWDWVLIELSSFNGSICASGQLTFETCTYFSSKDEAFT